MTIVGKKNSAKRQAGQRLLAPNVPPYARVLGLKAATPTTLIKQIENGLPYAAWNSFLRITALSTEKACRVVQIPMRTLRRRHDAGRLRPEESDRLVRVARLFGMVLDLFAGEIEEARRWFVAPQVALGGAAPIDYAVTDVGSRELETLIGRLEHGIVC